MNEEFIKYLNNFLYYAKHANLVFNGLKSSEGGINLIVKYISDSSITTLLKLYVDGIDVFIGTEFICYRSDLPLFVQELISATE